MDDMRRQVVLTEDQLRMQREEGTLLKVSACRGGVRLAPVMGFCGAMQAAGERTPQHKHTRLCRRRGMHGTAHDWQ